MDQLGCVSLRYARTEECYTRQMLQDNIVQIQHQNYITKYNYMRSLNSEYVRFKVAVHFFIIVSTLHIEKY